VWIRERLRDLGVEATAVVQQRTWSISTVLRAATRERDFYFKAVGPMFAAEPAVTRELGLRHPAHVPAVAAADDARGWMLMPDFDGESLETDGDPSTLADSLRAYARIQIAWIGRGDELLSIGCPDRALAALEARVEPLLGDTSLLLPGHPGGLSENELAAVPALAERLRRACERLRAYGLPDTLDHGDLHTRNVRRRDDGFLFFDWSDACLSVPFFSLVPFLEYHEEPLAQSFRDRLRDAYLEPWAASLGRGSLVDAFELAHELALFHQAISFHRLTEMTEPRARWEWERGVPYFVGKLLQKRRLR
nr:aminoglycoside phosphotransferase family protein [Actinomycetota bacterium]